MPLNYGRGARPPVECPRRRGGGDGYSREVLKAALAHRTVEAFGKPVEREVPAWGPVLGARLVGQPSWSRSRNWVQARKQLFQDVGGEPQGHGAFGGGGCQKPLAHKLVEQALRRPDRQAGDP